MHRGVATTNDFNAFLRYDEGRVQRERDDRVASRVDDEFDFDGRGVCLRTDVPLQPFDQIARRQLDGERQHRVRAGDQFPAMIRAVAVIPAVFQRACLPARRQVVGNTRRAERQARPFAAQAGHQRRQALRLPGRDVQRRDAASAAQIELDRRDHAADGSHRHLAMRPGEVIERFLLRHRVRLSSQLSA